MLSKRVFLVILLGLQPLTVASAKDATDPKCQSFVKREIAVYEKNRGVKMDPKRTKHHSNKEDSAVGPVTVYFDQRGEKILSFEGTGGYHVDEQNIVSNARPGYHTVLAFDQCKFREDAGPHTGPVFLIQEQDKQANKILHHNVNTCFPSPKEDLPFAQEICATYAIEWKAARDARDKRDELRRKHEAKATEWSGSAEAGNSSSAD